MKTKLKTWRKIGIFAISLAIPAAAEGGKQSRDVVAAGKGGTTTMKTTGMNTKSSKQSRQTKPVVRAQDLAAMSNAKKAGGKTPIKPFEFTHIIDKASPVILLKRSSKKPEQKPLTKKAVGLSDAKDPKQTRQTKPVVRAQDLAPMSNAKKAGGKTPDKGKVKVSDIPITKPVDKATPKYH